MNNIFFSKLDELSKNNFKIKFVDELKDEIIAFYNKEGELSVFSSVCPHFGGPIKYDFKAKEFKCSWHAWRFCSNTGKCLSYSINTKLKKYKYKIENNNIFLVQDL